ncbi:hypothetical protein BJ138DRAFT_1091533 [Hygrophoropsis aurantiaca]|uniref:Uncharacterized protein n=1 Tax=Hygrophoropsis aurantiaca TaxID=72124 RepID=A0ACB8A506_9AGAM|nr:hypothetical protein BJ138DRAFT_1091533 [Hygrophoropsis aurantiaca]
MSRHMASAGDVSTSHDPQLTENEAEVVLSKSRSRAVKGRRGTLALFPTLSLDIIYEIFQHLSPIDLLHLSRTTKAFRRMLISKSSAFLWRDARQNVDLPACPPDMSEPQYAALAFEPICSGCGKVTSAIMWQFNSRFCVKCRKLKFEDMYWNTNTKAICSKLAMRADQLNSILPEVSGSTKRVGYYIPQLQAFREQIKHLGLPDLESFVANERERTEVINQRAELCNAWYKSIIIARMEELHNLRTKREQAVRANLVARGWQDVIDGVGWERLSLSTIIGQSKEALTPKNWQKIEKPLIAYMAEWKEFLAEERVYSHRRKLFLEIWNYTVAFLVPATIHKCLPLPPDADVCLLSPMDDLIRVPQCPEVPADTFRQMFMVSMPLISERIMEWHIVNIRKLARLLPECDSSGNILALIARLQLATSIFQCKNERGCKWRYAMTYYEVLYHPCLQLRESPPRKNPALRAKDESIARTLNGYSLDLDQVKLHESVQVVANIVTSCGKDPNTTTQQDMSLLNPRLSCELCKYYGMETYMTWTTAVQHGCIHVPQRCKWRMLAANEKNAIISLEGPAVPYLCEPHRFVYRCTRCPRRISSWEAQTLERVLDHLRLLHEVTDPEEGIDYIFDSSIVPVLIPPVTISGNIV